MLFRRTVVSIPNSPSALAVKEAAGSTLLCCYYPRILLDGEHGIDKTFKVAQKVWAETFFYLAENNVMFEGILLKPSMVTPGAQCKTARKEPLLNKLRSTLLSFSIAEFLLLFLESCSCPVGNLKWKQPRT